MRGSEARTPVLIVVIVSTVVMPEVKRKEKGNKYMYKEAVINLHIEILFSLLESTHRETLGQMWPKLGKRNSVYDYALLWILNYS